MLRGFLLGTVSGLAFAAVVLGTASLVARQPAGNTPPERPQTDLPDAVPQTLPAPDAAEPGTAGPVAGDSPSLGPAPMVAPPSAAPALPVTDTVPADQPEPTVPDATLSAPETAAAPAVAPSGDPAVTPGRHTPAPQIPPAEAAVAMSTTPPPLPADAAGNGAEPEQPAAPDAPAAAADAVATAPEAGAAPGAVAPPAPGPQPEAMADAAPPTAADPAPVDAVSTAPATPLPQPDDLEIAPSAAADAPPPVAAPEVAVLPEADAAPAAPAADQAVPEPVPPGPVLAEQGPAEEPEDAPAEQQAAADPAAAPAARPLPGGDVGVRVNRPQPGTEPTTEASPTPDAGSDGDADGAAAGTAGADAPALVRHAAAFDNDAGLPLLSLVLIDDGSMPAGPQVAGAIGLVVTIAIDPARADADQAMADWRAAGHEVVALARLPEGATAVDADVVLRATFATLPETVALIDLGAGGLQGDRGLTERALRILAETGRGFVSASGGLDPGLRLAGEAGVPAVEVLRDLDGAGQDAATIRRFMDNAAFRARQDGEAVVIARLRPDTVTALQLWTSANREAQVAFAPVSAILAAP